MLKQVVVAEIPFDHGMRAEPYIARPCCQLSPELARRYITNTIAQQQIRAVTKHLVLPHAPAQVNMSRSNATALIPQLDLAEPPLCRTLGNKVENSRWIRRPIQRSAKPVDDLDLLILLQRGRRGHSETHSVLAVILHVAALHAPRLRSQNLRSLHLLEHYQRQILRGLFEIS